jgi:small subunit ribosomal protein S18
MTSKKNKARSARTLRENARKIKKKANPLKIDKVEYIDYKDVSLLQKFMSDRSKIRGRAVSGTTVQEQRELANAIKNAREMALLPYAKRVTSTRAPRGGAGREEEADLEMEDANLGSTLATDVDKYDVDDIDDADTDDSLSDSADSSESSVDDAVEATS